MCVCVWVWCVVASRASLKFVLCFPGLDLETTLHRIRSLIAKECRNGRSVFSMLEEVDRAAHRRYRPHGYAEADFQRAFLIYKLGGRSAAELSHHMLGTPSINATKRHIAVLPLKSSPGFPTSREIIANLQTIYPSHRNIEVERSDDTIVEGMVMEIDEIKIQGRLRWDPHSNMILGVCREHGHQCALEFRSEVQADALLDCLNNGLVHLAEEVCR